MEDSLGLGVVATQLAVIVLVVGGLVVGVLVVAAVLGLTGFSALDRFRKRRREDGDDGGIDDLF